MVEYKLKLIASTEKCFCDERIDEKKGISSLSMLRNERLSFQAAYTVTGDTNFTAKWCSLTVDSPIIDKISVARIENVPVSRAAYPWETDKGYLRTEPGLYPDVLIPQKTNTSLPMSKDILSSLLITVSDTDGIEPGSYDITVTLSGEAETVSESIRVTVIDASLPEQELIHTEWFHCDCIATYYGCEMFSDRHFELIGNYMEAALRCGVNMILTPVLTPPLDTAEGHERPTAQLVDITVTNGVYSFSYTLLDRFVRLALEKGMKYFEISHLFSQWGAKFAPKVMATVDGEYKRIFGWETEGVGEEYRAFIRAFTADLAEHLRALGIADRCYFHISDEPHLDHLPGYLAAKNSIADILHDFKFMDALSDYTFYETGAVDTPIPCTDRIEPFIENNVPDLWAYYCCAQHTDVSNRFIAMPGARTRVLGTQLFKFDIKGFLQWGFNFWYSHHSLMPINPYLETCGSAWVPAGDAFNVYPGSDGHAVYSLHSVHFFEALQDLRAMRLLEKKLGHDAVVALIEQDCAEPITFKKYPAGDDYILALREKINRELAK